MKNHSLETEMNPPITNNLPCLCNSIPYSTFVNAFPDLNSLYIETVCAMLEARFDVARPCTLRGV